MKRGEGDASAAWIGHRRPLRRRNGRSKSLDASGGGDGTRSRQTPPPGNAIGLSSPVGDGIERCNGRAKPVAFRPPPSYVPKVSLRHRGRDENGRAKSPRTPLCEEHDVGEGRRV